MALYITRDLNAIFSPAHQKEIILYLYNHQNEDGGWGFHIEGHSTMFASALSYIALRILGEGPEDGEDGAMARGRRWILDHGGLVAIPSWGKFLVSGSAFYVFAQETSSVLLAWIRLFSLSPRSFSSLWQCVYSLILRVRSVCFYRRYPVTRSVAAFVVVPRSDCHKLRSRRYSLTGAWPARTGILSAREGYASFLKPSLWLLVVVRGGWVLLESQDMARVSHAPIQAMTGSFR
ncbi:beta-amyrin synthase-like [Alnus glutinosa]|uniref:beta-amyrin synthase-like n=1 Tax=Alnus glutinosa TaxID=3517 RepID=UPI002D7A1390|nr:beta-amyrin synthase-like [Alnus glutinosa]